MHMTKPNNARARLDTRLREKCSEDQAAEESKE